MCYLQKAALRRRINIPYTAFLRQRIESKNHPAKQNGQKGIDMAQPSRRLVKPIGKRKLFNEQKDAVIGAPNKKIPASAVPDSGEQPHDGDITDML